MRWGFRRGRWSSVFTIAIVLEGYPWEGGGGEIRGKILEGSD